MLPPLLLFISILIKGICSCSLSGEWVFQHLKKPLESRLAALSVWWARGGFTLGLRCPVFPLGSEDPEGRGRFLCIWISYFSSCFVHFFSPATLTVHGTTKALRKCWLLKWRKIKRNIKGSNVKTCNESCEFPCPCIRVEGRERQLSNREKRVFIECTCSNLHFLQWR